MPRSETSDSSSQRRMPNFRAPNLAEWSSTKSSNRSVSSKSSAKPYGWKANSSSVPRVPMRITNIAVDELPTPEGTPDPYIALRVGTNSFETSVKRKRTNANWDDVFSFQMTADDILYVTVWDDGRCENIGEVWLPANQLVEDWEPGQGNKAPVYAPLKGPLGPAGNISFDVLGVDRLVYLCRPETPSSGIASGGASGAADSWDGDGDEDGARPSARWDGDPSSMRPEPPQTFRPDISIGQSGYPSSWSQPPPSTYNPPAPSVSFNTQPAGSFSPSVGPPGSVPSHQIAPGSQRPSLRPSKPGASQQGQPVSFLTIPPDTTPPASFWQGPDQSSFGSQQQASGSLRPGAPSVRPPKAPPSSRPGVPPGPPTWQPPVPPTYQQPGQTPQPPPTYQRPGQTPQVPPTYQRPGQTPQVPPTYQRPGQTPQVPPSYQRPGQPQVPPSYQQPGQPQVPPSYQQPPASIDQPSFIPPSFLPDFPSDEYEQPPSSDTPSAASAPTDRISVALRILGAQGLQTLHCCPNPYVILRDGCLTRRTDTRYKCPDPVWNQDFAFNMDPSDELTIEVVHDDGESGVILGSVQVLASDMPYLFNSGRFGLKYTIRGKNGVGSAVLMLRVDEGETQPEETPANPPKCPIQGRVVGPVVRLTGNTNLPSYTSIDLGPEFPICACGGVMPGALASPDSVSLSDMSKSVDMRIGVLAAIVVVPISSNAYVSLRCGQQYNKTAGKLIVRSEAVWDEWFDVTMSTTDILEISLHDTDGSSVGFIGNVSVKRIDLTRIMPYHEIWINVMNNCGAVAAEVLLAVDTSNKNVQTPSPYAMGA